MEAAFFRSGMERRGEKPPGNGRLGEVPIRVECSTESMEITDIPIPPEEYPFIAFGMTWLIDYVVANTAHARSGKPDCVLIDDTPSMAGAECDLVYWWHKSIQYFPDLENRARVRMLQLTKENKRLDRSELAKYIDVTEDVAKVQKAYWKFRVSRIGIDVKSRQAIGHFFVTLDGMWLTWGCILVIEWDDDDVIRLKTVRHTVGPGK
jgi:hypothetical protein